MGFTMGSLTEANRRSEFSAKGCGSGRGLVETSIPGNSMVQRHGL
jgi:hypothetical protein